MVCLKEMNQIIEIYVQYLLFIYIFKFFDKVLFKNQGEQITNSKLKKI